MCVEPRENGCSRTPRIVKKFPTREVVKSFVVSLADWGDIPPETVSS